MKLIAEWKSLFGKHYLKLYQHDDGSFSYSEDGGGGCLGTVSEHQAMQRMHEKVEALFHIDRINLKRCP